MQSGPGRKAEVAPTSTGTAPATATASEQGMNLAWLPNRLEQPTDQ